MKVLTIFTTSRLAKGKRTRLTLVYRLILLAIAEAIIKTIFPPFPLTELYAFEGMVGGGYLGARSYTDAKGVRDENNNIVGD